MPGVSFKQINVRCPYYISDNGKSMIVCEGLAKGSTTRLNFRRTRDYLRQIDGVCSADYWNCLLCEALDRKHEDD